MEVGFGLKDLKNAAGADTGAGDQAPALGQLVDRNIELRQVGDEDDQLADRQGAREYRARADIDDERSSRCDESIDDARIKCLPAVELERGAEADTARPHEAAVLLLFLGEGLNDLDRRNRLLDDRIDP